MGGVTQGAGGALNPGLTERAWARALQLAGSAYSEVGGEREGVVSSAWSVLCLQACVRIWR